MQIAKPRILVVEDEFFVAEAIGHAVRSEGWDVAGPADAVTTALEIAQSETLDAAVLDLNVEGRLVWPVAAVLRERGVPFLFLTGYDQSQLAHPDYRDAPTIGKPFTERDLLAQLARLLTGGERNPPPGDAPTPPFEGE